MRRATALLSRLAPLVAVALSLTSAASAQATEAVGDHAQAKFIITPIFELLDCGDEGYVQAGEVDEHLGELYQNLHWARRYHEYVEPAMSDADKASLARTEEALLDSMDSNADDEVSRLEYRARLIELIVLSDIDGDGEVTLAELETGSTD
jgi:hypothetical protein